MDQDLSSCPGCGAYFSDQLPCPYCGWTSEANNQPTPPQIASSTEAATPNPTNETASKEPGEELPHGEEISPAPFRDLTKPGDDTEHLLDQVPEEMRGVLAARLKAAYEITGSNFSEATASALREQGYVVSEDAHGARLTASPGNSDDFSPSDVVKLAADLDGGVQPQTKLPICGNCRSASPIGELQCQWCGQPFSGDQ